MADKILVIDDAPVIRKFLHEVLADAGFEVDTAENGKEGLELIADSEYSIIFCDVHMPVMNGLQTIKSIKMIKPDIPIIMTDSLPEKEAEDAAKAGAIRCLAKPFDLHELQETIRSVLSDKISSPK